MGAFFTIVTYNRKLSTGTRTRCEKENVNIDDELTQDRKCNTSRMPDEEAIEFIAPKSKVHQFTDIISDKTVLFQIIKLKETIIIYINNIQQPSCNNISMAMNTRFSSNPNTAQLLGSDEHSASNMASRIAKKINKTVFLSLNLEDTRFIIPLVEKRLNEEVSKILGLFD
ncbi:proteasome assembly chaperone 4-like [Euwallacea similis]|uniref:proteasome assembly chaperone 4-like n=1 Tax=Euwallacea similis TaxID=1736056 RepID=UPI00344F564C